MAPSTLSLRQQLIDYENRRHAGRLKEIAHARKKLEMFQPTFEELESRGARLSLESVRVDYQGALSISRGGTTEFDSRLYSELITLGFRETSRSSTGHYLHLLLKKGRLSIALFVSADAMSAERSAA